jgi:hypothetical protein
MIHELAQLTRLTGCAPLKKRETTAAPQTTPRMPPRKPTSAHNIGQDTKGSPPQDISTLDPEKSQMPIALCTLDAPEATTTSKTITPVWQKLQNTRHLHFHAQTSQNTRSSKLQDDINPPRGHKIRQSFLLQHGTRRPVSYSGDSPPKTRNEFLKTPSLLIRIVAECKNESIISQR